MVYNKKAYNTFLYFYLGGVLRVDVEVLQQDGLREGWPVVDPAYKNFYVRQSSTRKDASLGLTIYTYLVFTGTLILKEG